MDVIREVSQQRSHLAFLEHPVSDPREIDVEDLFPVLIGHRFEHHHAGPDQLQVGPLVEPVLDLSGPISLMKDQAVATQVTAAFMDHFPEDLIYPRDLHFKLPGSTPAHDQLHLGRKE